MLRQKFYWKSLMIKVLIYGVLELLCFFCYVDVYHLMMKTLKERLLGKTFNLIY